MNARTLMAAALPAALALALAAAPAHAADAYPCGGQTSKPWSAQPVQRCPLIPSEAGDRIPVYAQPVTRAEGAPLPRPAGWLNGTAGQYFACQARTASAFHHARGWRNVHWAYTAADSGIDWGWVPEVYFKGGDDDEPDAGLRTCDASMTPHDDDRRPIPVPTDLKPDLRFQLPFPCGQKWRIDNWGHNPALDMVREPQHRTFRSPVVAAYGGTIVISRRHPGSGHMVQIDHPGRWFTTYIHLDSRSVRTGQRVKQGTKLGTVGKTGTQSNDNVHLHFELAWTAARTADWGDPAVPRVDAWFNGKRYSSSQPNTTWRNVKSHNCTFEQRDRGGRMEQRDRPR